MADKYSVQRQSLREVATYLSSANKNWIDIANTLANAKIGPDDLGIIGKKTNVVSKYNTGVDHAWQQIDEGVANLDLMIYALNLVAANYGHAEHKSIDTLRDILRDMPK
ncbi:hypothetical protein [Actinomadura violacea]|uniref:NTP pyrophosphohydrolase MazG putative catalytic core domain-containing protein n=1 Tax=Actinomadura violacea TaxID=2819934 RepID=A0ABS3RP43_9ACTN|nr:hypothetical protein [Actinomadura violacea]MBO2458527.1 hypothetical protein [Actinomadura violacea]